ncbi:MAG: hypothetical protein H0U75_09050 [Legionella sp.]|nr:hypothetical protein [Legionella sp.]
MLSNFFKHYPHANTNARTVSLLIFAIQFVGVAAGDHHQNSSEEETGSQPDRALLFSMAFLACLGFGCVYNCYNKGCGERTRDIEMQF